MSEHRFSEEGDGHGHNHWRCPKCGKTWWIAPWVSGVDPGVCDEGRR